MDDKTAIFSAVIAACVAGTFIGDVSCLGASIDRELERVEGTDGTEFRLSWRTQADRIYDLHWSADLEMWSSVGGFPKSVIERFMEHRFGIGPERLFFRVVDLGQGNGGPEPKPLEVYFSHVGPTGQEEDCVLEEKIIDLLELAEPGSEVFVALYAWSRRNMAEAFISAYERGVDVQMILGSEYPAVTMLTEALPEDNVFICRHGGEEPTSCHGPESRINHNKFFLFSALSDGSKDVVVQSSANFTNTQLRMNNNMVVIRNDTALYNAYHQYWHDMRREVYDEHYYWYSESDSGIVVYFFPRNDGGDTIVDLLEVFDDIPCGFAGRIHVGMSRWTWARSAIAERLAELSGEGCSVKVIVNPNNTNPAIIDLLEEGGVEVTRFEHVHSKYMIVDTGYGRRPRFVVTGSKNYSDGGLRRGDDAMLRIADATLYEAFLEDWKRMRAHPLADGGAGQ